MLEQLINIVYNYVELDEVTADMSFKGDLGLSSFDTVCMISEIESTLGVKLSPADFINHKTVGSLAEFMGGK